jgi:hypothetical protein
MNNDCIKLENFEAFVTLLEEAYGDYDHVNTAEWVLAKLHQGNQDFIMYYIEFQHLIMDLNWNDAAKWTTLHHSLSEELKDILRTQDYPKEWSCYVMLMTKCNMQYCMHKVESYYSLGQNKPVSMLAPYNTSPVPAQPVPHLTSSGSGYFAPTPIDLSAAGHCLSPKECQKRIDEGHCLYCGSFNYMAHDCPNKPKASGHPLHSAVAKTATQSETPISSTSTSQSGNV